MPNGEEAKITVSIGAAHAKGALDYNTVIAAVDQALYEAKDLGRNRVCLAQSL
jgi:diguanylate cyclase